MISRISLALLVSVAATARADTALWMDRPAARLWLPELEAASERTHLPVPLIAELIGSESGFQPAAANPHSSAFGCGQQIAANGTMRRYRLDRRSCADSIMGAALQLRAELDRTGALDRALDAYGTTSGHSPAQRQRMLQRFAALLRHNDRTNIGNANSPGIGDPVGGH
jgi:hypothetical protein